MNSEDNGSVTSEYVAFPFRVDASGARVCDRVSHVRHQIEQVLFTNPQERVFRPEFGAGIKKLVFEPNATALWEITRKRLVASLAEALREEVDPKTLEIDVVGEAEKLKIIISYTLATISQQEQHEYLVGS
jgi:phage baseplate assembly protein W